MTSALTLHPRDNLVGLWKLAHPASFPFSENNVYNVSCDTVVTHASRFIFSLHKFYISENHYALTVHITVASTDAKWNQNFIVLCNKQVFFLQRKEIISSRIVMEAERCDDTLAQGMQSLSQTEMRVSCPSSVLPISLTHDWASFLGKESPSENAIDWVRNAPN